MSEVELKCACGKVQGSTESVNSESGTRIVCCCDDCQKFAQYLGQEDRTLDEYGGTDIFQMPISHLQISEGAEFIACIRLSSKGLYRWYAKCCGTPIGNSMGAGVPFMGLIHNFMEHKTSRDADLGPSRGYIQTKFAKKEIPESLKATYIRIVLRGLSKLLVWKIKGLNTPSAFFSKNGKPIVEPTIVD